MIPFSSMHVYGEGSNSAARPLRRAALIASLLIVEYVLISWLFDIQPLLAHGEWWNVMGHLGSFAPAAVIVATATLLLSGARLRDELEALSDTFARHRPLVPLIVHGCSYLGLLVISRRLFDPENPELSFPLLLTWVVVALLTMASAAIAAFPPRALLPFLRRGGTALLAGLTVGLVAWGAGLLTGSLWEPLGRQTLVAVASLLQALPVELIYEPEDFVVGTRQFSITVAPVCSGYQGIGLIIVFVGAFLIWARRRLRFPAALILLPIGIVAVWIANVIRIAALILVGSFLSPAVALGGFHAKAGWLLFCGLAVGLVAIAQRSQLLGAKPRANLDVVETWNPTAIYLGPFLVVMAVALFTGLFTTGLDLAYPLRVAAGIAALWYYRKSLGPLAFGEIRTEPRRGREVSRKAWFPVALGAVAFMIWIVPDLLMTPLETPSTWPRELSTIPTTFAVGWILFRILGLVAVAPIVEELAFRGFLLRRIISDEFTEVPYSHFTWASFLVSSAAFGLMHERWIAAMLAGMLFALAMLRRGRIGDAIIAHGVSNALLAITVLATGRWSWLG